MRSRVVPLLRCCSTSYAEAVRSAGICNNQLGACWCNSSTRRAPSRPLPNCPKASSSGRYASPAPYCSIHCPRANHTVSLIPSCATKASTRVVLPIPASPVTNTTWRVPWSACVHHWCSCAISACRATSSAGGVSTVWEPLEGSAAASGVGAGSCCTVTGAIKR
jgi:hypothetical protein